MNFHPEIRSWLRDCNQKNITRLRVCAASNKKNGRIEFLRACLQERNHVIDRVAGGL